MKLTRNELMNYLHSKEDSDNIFENDCETAIFLLDNCEITIPDENRFFVRVNCDWLKNEIIIKRGKKIMPIIKQSGLAEGEEVLAYTGLYDFNHVSPEWESIINMGFVGLKERIDSFVEKSQNDYRRKNFYLRLSDVYAAILRFMKRAALCARMNGRTEMAEGLEHLSQYPPRNLFEAMQLSQAYYVIQMWFDGTILRTLGRIDRLFYPFYVNEKSFNIKELIRDYLKETDSFKYTTNIPFAIGGTDEKGECTINELSYLLLDGYINTDTSYVKMHIICSENTPEDIMENALDAIRNGKNSIVFMSDKMIIESLMNIGVQKNDAMNYHIVGCYECGGNNETTCSCNARVNLPKALELALNGGCDMMTGKQIGLENDGDFESYKALYDECRRQLEFLCECAMQVTDIYEKNYSKIHTAPIFSGTYISALENGGDIYGDYAARYNNSSVNGIGLATLVDSLIAIKKIVYDDKLMSLNSFREILKSNWLDEEELRFTIKNKFPKFGNADETVDETAKDITDLLVKTISGRKNAKGGIYRLGLFSLDWRWEFGEKTAASADGRLSGETLSQNTSASFGMDRQGATAHILSVLKIDASKMPNGVIPDIDLHYSAVMGKNGLNAMKSMLQTYLELGGFAIQFNVLNTDTLKQAKLNPELYPNLQVRLCGWNVLFKNLSDKEKDEFIKRSEI